VEGHIAVNSCKDCVVFAHANACGWPKLGAALTHDDVSGTDDFAAVFFNAKTTTS
jgi:hypothetical protein